MSIEIEGWTYDADLHCHDCAMIRFGAQFDESHTYLDNDGNKATPVLSTDEQSPWLCADCGRESRAYLEWSERLHDTVYATFDEVGYREASIYEGACFFWHVREAYLALSESSTTIDRELVTELVTNDLDAVYTMRAHSMWSAIVQAERATYQGDLLDEIGA